MILLSDRCDLEVGGHRGQPLLDHAGTLVLYELSLSSKYLANAFLDGKRAV